MSGAKWLRKSRYCAGNDSINLLHLSVHKTRRVCNVCKVLKKEAQRLLFRRVQCFS